MKVFHLRGSARRFFFAMKGWMKWLMLLLVVASVLGILTIKYMSQLTQAVSDYHKRDMQYVEILSSTDETPAQRSQALTRMLTSAALNITKLQSDIEHRDMGFSQKLDDIRNIALAELEVGDQLNNLISNVSKLQQQNEKTQKLLESLSNHSRKADHGLAVDEKEAPTLNNVPVRDTRTLNRSLLILVGYLHSLLAQKSIPDYEQESLNLRTLFFSVRGLNPNITNYDLFSVCLPGNGCEFTADASRFNESDVVIIYSGNKDYQKMDQDNRRLVRAFPEQRFVFHFFEQPFYWEDSDMTIINNRVGMNWTLHYQRDATVFWPYGQVRLRDAPVAIRPNYYASKARKVIWIVSRCFTLYAHREHYVAELIKYIDIDVFGKCSSDSATRVPMDIPKVARHYKFYISFENGDCDDYITEKFFRTLKDIDVIPVVYGRRNGYEKYAPPYSYIQADQFDSPHELAAYLYALDKDDAAYQKYFEWKRTHVSFYMPRPVCEMCRIFRDKWFEPSQIDMHHYHGRQRCWKANRNMISNYATKMNGQANFTFSDPWTIINKFNSKDKKLRFNYN